MPICDPIRERKVAPNSDAFSKDASRGGRTVTYQSALAASINNYYTTIGVSERDLYTAKGGLMVSIAESENRAKHWVGDYMTVVDWDITIDQTLWLNAWHPIPFNHEVIRGYGARCNNRRLYLGAGDPGYVHWYHRLVKGQEGIWWYAARLSITFTVGMAVTSAKLGIFVNNVLYSVIDELDADMAGDGAAMIDCILGGGRHVPLNAGDYVDIRLYTAGPASGSSLFLSPSSLTGYVTGHRERCDTSIISTPGTGFGYSFTA